MSVEQSAFQKLLVACHEVAGMYEPDIVFIGGIAVYLHAMNHENTRPYAEMTADADFYISLSALSDLRDIEEVVQNTRLSKHEFQKAGFSFDVYTERQSSLPVPYADVIAHAVRYEGVAVAPLEYLLVLKLEAAVDRHGSAHGQKDARDIIRLLLLAGSQAFDATRSTLFMRDDHLVRLKAIVNGPEFIALARGNAKEAKALRAACSKIYETIAAAAAPEA
jgi:predicted nucleotidyltransferase